ncbi:chitin synthase-domain-containing protein [Cladochytrium replicatum]|nr:chitin synthase-domain-containing protein [Cladochytrium replicatum]
MASPTATNRNQPTTTSPLSPQSLSPSSHLSPPLIPPKDNQIVRFNVDENTLDSSNRVSWAPSIVEEKLESSWQGPTITLTPAQAVVSTLRRQPSGLRRNNSSALHRTLSRPERKNTLMGKKPMLRDPEKTPPAARAGATSNRLGTLLRAPDGTLIRNQPPAPPTRKEIDYWAWSARIMTFCCFPSFLRWMGKSEPAIQQAWREKVALCIIISILCFCMAFLTVGLEKTLCPAAHPAIALMNPKTLTRVPLNKAVSINGFAYDINEVGKALSSNSNGALSLTLDYTGTDLSRLFKPASDSCSGFYKLSNRTSFDCTVPKPLASASSIVRNPAAPCADPAWIKSISLKNKRFIPWDELSLYGQAPNQLIVLSGWVVNFTNYYLPADPTSLDGGVKFSAELENIFTEHIGKDGTRALLTDSNRIAAMQCALQRWTVGRVEVDEVSCFANQMISYLILIIILALVLTRFFMAITFYWCLSGKLLQPKAGTAAHARMSHTGPRAPIEHRSEPDDPYCCILVTCYSEGDDGIRTTLESLARSQYPDERKLLFIVCDGIITGSGQTRSTPEIVLSMIQEDKTLTNPDSVYYIAIAHGSKQLNAAKVHAGHFVTSDGHHRVPIVVVVKTGGPSEIDGSKPGNRGKRDSQMLLLNFFSRVLFDDRMTPLDYDLFYKIRTITGVAPDAYETLLMVDADTGVLPTALRYMNDAMKFDDTIMGLCGETRIANKKASWVSAIQVFEYHISHHLGKSFESVFGGVTCLPGCFCMYRIKVRKHPEMGMAWPSGHAAYPPPPKKQQQQHIPEEWIPIVVNPDILDEYSENVVDTLHKKNLLLLGEDRFLSTLMLRTFPRRRMVFLPHAICKTVVPDTFKVLLSQRRRWINSTIHNLLELVLLPDLCGTFCFSMQFVVLLELIGTVVLPAAICLTTYLIVNTIVTADPQIIPLLMLFAILGLPGVLILATTRKAVYVLWMLVYLCALPVWNFVLPVYAFWHFDDFSWGQTRKVEGETKDKGHGDSEGVFEHEGLVLKRWEEWERERRARVLGVDAKSTMRRGDDYDVGEFVVPRARASMVVTPIGGGGQRGSFIASLGPPQLQQNPRFSYNPRASFMNMSWNRGGSPAPSSVTGTMTNSTLTVPGAGELPYTMLSGSRRGSPGLSAADFDPAPHHHSRPTSRVGPSQRPVSRVPPMPPVFDPAPHHHMPLGVPPQQGQQWPASRMNVGGLGVVFDEQQQHMGGWGTQGR